jgi:hypothetical protein
MTIDLIIIFHKNRLTLQQYLNKEWITRKTHRNFSHVHFSRYINLYYQESSLMNNPKTTLPS